MAYNRRLLEGREGDDALTWWRAVWDWANSLPVITGPGVELNQQPGYGAQIKVRTAAPVRIFFEVALSGLRVSVRPGMLEGDVPYVVVGPAAYVNLYGETPELRNVGAPSIDLAGAEPGPDGRSAIVIAAKLDARGNLRDARTFPGNLVVEHRSEFGRNQKREADAAGRPFHELAILYWQDGAPVRVGQVVQHNLALAAGPLSDDPDAGSRYFFYAAG